MNTELLQHYEQYLLLEQGLSANTREAYGRDLRRFLDYAGARHVDALDVDLPLLETMCSTFSKPALPPVPWHA